MKTINNNIEEKEVGFPNAKLLKEKGFKQWCLCNYFKERPRSYGLAEHKFKSNETLLNIHGWDNMLHDGTYEQSDIFTIAPTQQVAIDWILINFGIHIHVETDSYGECFYPKISSASKKTWDNLELRSLIIASLYNISVVKYNTPEEAKEATINYTLTKLLCEK